MTATVTQLPTADNPDTCQDAWHSVRHIADLSYRQFDYWCRAGLVVTYRFAPDDAQGSPRLIRPEEIRIVERMAQLVAAGITPPVAVRYARELAANGYVRLAKDVLLVGPRP